MVDAKKTTLLNAAVIASVFVALTLIVIKSIAWLATGSVAMLGSLLDSILDSVASLTNFFLVRWSIKPADEDHRFGHGKAEPIGGFIQAAIIGGSALFLIAESVRRFIEPVLPDNSSLGIVILIVSSCLVALLVLFQRYVSKQTGSMVIEGDALHGLGDIVINLGVIAALLGSEYFDSVYIDPVMGILLAGVLLKGAWSISQKALLQLMDAEFSEQERQHIFDIANGFDDVRDVHDLRTRKAGFDIFIQFHLELDGTMQLRKAHRISDEVELAIKQAFPGAEVLIHQDPHGEEDIPQLLKS